LRVKSGVIKAVSSALKPESIRRTQERTE